MLRIGSLVQALRIFGNLSAPLRNNYIAKYHEGVAEDRKDLLKALFTKKWRAMDKPGFFLDINTLNNFVSFLLIELNLK